MHLSSSVKEEPFGHTLQSFGWNQFYSKQIASEAGRDCVNKSDPSKKLKESDIRFVGQWISIVNPRTHLPVSPSGINTIDASEPVGSHPDCDVNIVILNSTALYSASSRQLDQARQHKSSLRYVNEFIRKVLQAIHRESGFAKSASQQEAEFGSRTSFRSGGDCSDNATTEATLPKLGKVYAELRTCIKTLDELSASRTHFTNRQLSSEHSFIRMRRKCRELKGKILLHVRWLIEARLVNISRLALFHFGDSGTFVECLFMSGDGKRFFKLVEVYNDYATRFRKNCPSNEVEVYCRVGRQFMQSPQPSVVNGADSFGTGVAEKWNSQQPCSVYPLSLKHILDYLSCGFLERIGHQTSTVMANCMSPEQNWNEDYGKGKNTAPFPTYSVWADASRIQVRPVQPKNGNKSSFFRVIKRVAGVNVPDLNMDKAVEECSVLDGWFSKQEQMVSVFTTGLNGKTKLLRRSLNFQDAYLSDDTMSVASSESVTPRRQSEVKTVKWRDSWGNEAVKSLTSHYHEFLLTALPISYINSCTSLLGVPFGNASYAPGNGDLVVMMDIDSVLLHAFISNLAHLNVLDDSVHRSLQTCATRIVIDCALSASDNFMCEMLGKSSPSSDKASIRKLPDTNLMTVSHLCLQSLHPLIYVMEMHASQESLARDVLPRVESVLTSVFWWIRKKIQEFFSTWDLSSLIQICMSDLREITNISLDCLRLVESCHNHIESNRNSNSAALHVATQLLQNVDTLITNMQVTSASCMERLGKESYSIAYKVLEKVFPPQKAWLQRHAIDSDTENMYVKELIHSVVRPLCDAVKEMDSQSQLAGLSPVITAIYDSCLAFIGKSKFKFSTQGGLQLFNDFSTIINFVTADISGLSSDVQVALSSLHSIKRALHVAQLLQSTYEYNDDETTDRRFRPESKVRSASTTSLDEAPAGGEFDDKFWLSLRQRYVRKSKTWTSFLPCVES